MLKAGDRKGESVTQELSTQRGWVDTTVMQTAAGLDLDNLARLYREQNEFLVLQDFLPRALVAKLLSEVEAVRPSVHRNYIPRHKKGGSVSAFTLAQMAPTVVELYRAPGFRDFLTRMTNTSLLFCPDEDPHAYALYFYTEPGDHIGFHYDTSYYKGSRYTVLIGLIDHSTSRLVCRLYNDDQSRETQELRLATDPGSLILFNGDKLYHSVTPLGNGEERVVLTLQYVTNQTMGPVKRFISNMKDTIAYFGLSAWTGRTSGRSG